MMYGQKQIILLSLGDQVKAGYVNEFGFKHVLFIASYIILLFLLFTLNNLHRTSDGLLANPKTRVFQQSAIVIVHWAL